MRSVAPQQAPEIFSASARQAKRRRGRLLGNDAAFIHEAAADDIVDRLESVLRPFRPALFVGPGAPVLRHRLTDTADVHDVVTVDDMAAPGIDHIATAAALPFADQQFELVVSTMALHAENDVAGALAEARRVLKPDGLFIAIFPGERTLNELRWALQTAEAAVTGKVGARVSPFIAVKDAGALLQHAGFAMPVADVIRLPISYSDPSRMIFDLRANGETCCLVASPKGALRRDVFAAAMGAYRSTFPGTDGDGILVTVELVAVTGWAPHKNQPQPKKPGSATASLATAIFTQRNV